MDLLTQLALVVVLGVVAQLVGTKLRIPGILFLLFTGIILGPISGVLRPDPIGSAALGPIVGLSVAIILFEGGLGLDFRELRRLAGAVSLLVTLGVGLTGAALAWAAHTFLGLGWGLSLLLGAILVLSGPTVVLPLLRSVQPSRNVERVLRWEGIIIDPIGAILAALVFEVLLHGVDANTASSLLSSMGILFGVGIVGGSILAELLVQLEKRFIVADYLREAFGLGMVVLCYALLESIVPEAGIIGVTVMGIYLANQRRVDVHHLLTFKETLSILLIGTLFILLSARLRLEEFQVFSLGFLAFLALAILVIRPIVALLCTIGSPLNLRERLFIGAMAPRGIVAAAVAAFFSIRLEEAGMEGASQLVGYVFLTIIGTVTFYSLAAKPIATLLGVRGDVKTGVLLVGANAISRKLATALQDQGLRAVILDLDGDLTSQLRTDGYEAYAGDLHDDQLFDEDERTMRRLLIDGKWTKVPSQSNVEPLMRGIGNVFALTHVPDLNSYACNRLEEDLGRKHLFQVASDSSRENGRILFGTEWNYQRLRDRMRSNDWEIRKTKLTEEFGEKQYIAEYGQDFQILFATEPTPRGTRLLVHTVDAPIEMRPGRTITSIVRRDHNVELERITTKTTERIQDLAKEAEDPIEEESSVETVAAGPRAETPTDPEARSR